MSPTGAFPCKDGLSTGRRLEVQFFVMGQSLGARMGKGTLKDPPFFAATSAACDSLFWSVQLHGHSHA